MIGLSLNDNTRAAALDGALAMSVLLHNQRDLTLASARSSVTGLITAIREAPDNYARLLDASSAAVSAFESSAERLVSPAWTPADSGTTDAIATAVQAQLPNDEEELANHPLHALAGKTPVTYELPNESSSSLFVSTWGDSGAISLTDATGHGIVIHHDGRVDTVPTSGHGWQFKTDATFLLPDGTKVSVSPETPASVLLTRGEQRLVIEGLAPGASPEVELADSGGLDADASRNDGHIFVMGATPQAWTLAGASVGQLEDERETVASAPIENELPVDVSKLPLPDDLASRIAALGLDAATFDTDQDGLFSHAELLEIVQAIDSAIGGAQTKFEGAMGQIGGSLAPLLRLTRFIEKALSEADRKHTERKQNLAEEQEQLRLIQRDLDAARNALRSSSGSPSTVPQAAPPEPPPVVLNRSPESTSPPAPPVVALPETGAAPAPSVPESPSPVLPVSSTELSSMRRAQRLLGGFSGPQYASLEPQPTGTEALPPPSDLIAPKPTEVSSVSAHTRSENLGSGDPAPQNVPAHPGIPDPAAARRSDGPPDVSESALRTSVNLPGAIRVPESTPGASMATAAEPESKPNPYVSVQTQSPTNPPSVDTGAAGRDQVRRRLDGHLALHRDHVARMRQLQDELRHVVTMLFNLVGQDDQLRVVFRADDLSDAQRSEFRARIAELEHEVGIGWGDSLERTPLGEARLHARMLASGMMI